MKFYDSGGGGTWVGNFAHSTSVFVLGFQAGGNLYLRNGTSDFTGSLGIGTTSPDRILHEEASDAVTNAVTYTQRHSHITSGTAATGFGVGEEYELENASGTNRVAASQEFTWSDATNATEDTTYSLKLMRAGTLTEAINVDSGGVLRVSGYNTFAQRY